MTEHNRIEELTRLLKDEVLFDDDVIVAADTMMNSLDSWDSLAVMGFVSVISEHFGVEIPFSDMEKLTTVSEVSDYIAQKTP